ncbi:hypothetical protein AGLY_015530 [Aphis glycines]|uniref:Uncharacterized protein n=1 Tax=Aphis glycines TaxID=307491 RepID=A0A6G0T0F0_APHGL|nr:hypothetical protein AGLY_015530 [Aphis glycines]
MCSYNFLITIRTTYEELCIKFSNFGRSDECIDFTMIVCFFFFVFITSRNNASISNFGGGFRWKSEYPWCIIEVKSKHFPTVFKEIEKNKKKNDGKTGIFTKIQFSTESIFYMVVIQKLITFEFIRNISKLRKFANNFVVGKSVDKIFLALSKYLKILYKVLHIIHMHNFFLLAFEVQILTKIR